jgi:hypothetical protein
MKMKPAILKTNQCRPEPSSPEMNGMSVPATNASKGEIHPPRKQTAVTADTVSIAMYSLRKKRPKRIPLYSV